MCSHHIIVALLVLGGELGAQARPVGPTSASAPPARDSLPALRLRYNEDIRQLIPRWQAAARAAFVADSLKGVDLPSDTLQVGALRFLIDRSQAELMQGVLTRAWSDVRNVFGREADQLAGTLFAARLRSSGTRARRLSIGSADSIQKVIDLAEVYPGRLDIFDRVRAEENPALIARLIATRSAKLLLQRGDSTLRLWLTEPIKPGQLQKGIRERMHADLVTAPSQVSSRCLAGDLRRCRDALGLIPTADALTEWYDPSERRTLVVRMKELLAVGPQLEHYRKCVDGHAYAVCDRILRAIPRFAVPPALPPSARHHLLRIALASGGSDAYSRMVAGPARSLEARISDGARMPIDSVVASWRADVLAARPAPPAVSLVSLWTAVGWGLAVMLASLRFASWR